MSNMHILSIHGGESTLNKAPTSPQHYRLLTVRGLISYSLKEVIMGSIFNINS